MNVYIDGHRSGDGGLSVPLPSAVLLYILNYCKSNCFHVNLVENAYNAVYVRMELSCLLEFDHSFISADEVPVKVANCVLPVIEDSTDFMIRSGLCCVVRHIIKITHAASLKQGDATYIDLLGFRAASLKACSEVSGWTKLCEVELPLTVSKLITLLQTRADSMSVEIPEDVMKLELHFDKPPLLHNDDKKKRALLKQLQQKFEKDVEDRNTEKQSTEHRNGGSHTDSDDEMIKQFFVTHECVMPHGNMYYRVITKPEKELKKFLNLNDGEECKYGCTENRLVKWCAKCNDREKLRRKEKMQARNNTRLVEGDGSSELCDSVSNLHISANGDSSANKFGVSTIEELRDYVSGLTLHDVVYEHVYAEGVGLTISDLMLVVYMYYLMETMEFKCSTVFQKLPNIKRWLNHILTLPRIEQTSGCCGFDLVAMRHAVIDTTYHTGMPIFTIPPVTLNVNENMNEISRGAKSKHKALKNDICRVLDKVKTRALEPEVGEHPYGNKVQLDWSSVPLAAHPRIELPEKRVGRKCEQLENLATAVKSVAKTGDVIVDFCSGAGHLGIIIAYLLPDCQVYLIENKEESLVRAKDRVKQLQLTNVTCYQCNLDYFQGHFDIGVCLHACGVATDLVLQQCLDRKASFVICPCCYGNIQNTHLISYPRSQHYKNLTFSDKDVIILGHAADQTEIDIDLQEQGRHCMNLVDTDRARLAVENGYTVTLCSLQPLSCTPKNNLLIGTRTSTPSR